MMMAAGEWGLLTSYGLEGEIGMDLYFQYVAYARGCTALRGCEGAAMELAGERRSKTFTPAL
eukprot:1137228-Pelagomonas_calceolata.AAC.1